MTEHPPAQPTVRATEEEAQANLTAVLELCAAGRLRCSEKTRRPSSATMKIVTEHLIAGDFQPDEAIAAFAWPLLLQAGGLAESAGGRLQLTARGRTSLGAPPAATIRYLWKRWVGHGLIDEFSRIEPIKGQRTTNTLTAVKTRRKTVATALAGCPPGTWIRVDDLFTTMRRGNLSPTIARSERAVWKLYLEDPQYGSLGYDGHNDWPILEGRYTLAVLFEYAGTLGLFDLDYTDPAGARDDYCHIWGADWLDYLSRYDGLHAVRLNALGAYAVGRTPAYERPALPAGATDTIKILPNLDIVTVGQVSPADRLLLNAFADQTGDRVWALSAKTLLTALTDGRRPEELVTFLAERTTHELPGTVRTLLDDATARARQLTDLGVVRVIECADPAVAALISRDRKLSRLCHPIGDRHLAVPAEHEATFRKALPAIGYVLPPGPGD